MFDHLFQQATDVGVEALHHGQGGHVQVEHPAEAFILKVRNTAGRVLLEDLGKPVAGRDEHLSTKLALDRH